MAPHQDESARGFDVEEPIERARHPLDRPPGEQGLLGHRSSSKRYPRGNGVKMKTGRGALQREPFALLRQNHSPQRGSDFPTGLCAALLCESRPPAKYV